MAFTVNDKNNTNSNTSSTANTLDSNSMLFGEGAVLSASIFAEYYKNFRDTASEVLRSANENLEVSIIDMERSNFPNHQYSALVVSAKHVDSDVVGYHVLLLERTGEKIPAAMENLNGQPITVTRFAGDALDSVMKKAAGEEVSKTWARSGGNPVCVYAEGTVVPEDFDPLNKAAVAKLVLNAGIASFTVASSEAGSLKPLNLSEIPRDKSLVVKANFIRTQLEDIAGNKARADMVIDFSAQNSQQSQNNYSPNAGVSESKISKASAFVDLVWASSQQNSHFGNIYQTQGQQQNTQKYAPRLVLTELNTAKLHTPEAVLLALASAVNIRQSNDWLHVFKQSPQDEASGINLRDIGALNIEAGIGADPGSYGERINTSDRDFTPEALYQVLNMLLMPGIMISIDVPLSGPQSWYLSMFAAASRGKKHALDIIVKASDNLTNGNFSQFFPANTPMFDDVDNIIFNGTWTDQKGQERDIRDIDTIAVCNIVGDRDPSLITAFSDTYLARNVPLIKRLDDRRRLLETFTNETANFTGYSERITFTGKFIEALLAGISATGIQARFESSATDNINVQRGYAEFANNAMLGSGAGFATPMGFNQYQQTASPDYAGWNSRW